MKERGVFAVIAERRIARYAQEKRRKEIMAGKRIAIKREPIKEE